MTSLIGCCFLLFNVLTANAVSYYYSYEDAKCVNEDTIKGTFVLSWDDFDYADFGYSASYYGGCLYLVDGSMDIATLNDAMLSGSYDYYSYGTCVECDGVVGCSSDGTCSNFQTYPAPEATSSSYQLSQGQSSSSTETTTAAPKYGATAKTVEASAMALVEGSSSESSTPVASEKMMMASFAIGMLIAGVLAGIIVVRRRGVGNKDLTSAMLELPRSALV
jgi:hypothetical protein